MALQLRPLAHLVKFAIELSSVLLRQTVEDQRLQTTRSPHNPHHTGLGRPVRVTYEDVADGKSVQVVKLISAAAAVAIAVAGGLAELGGGTGRGGGGGGGLVVIARFGVGATAVGAVRILACRGGRGIFEEIYCNTVYKGNSKRFA
jgi:hypothetical protein